MIDTRQISVERVGSVSMDPVLAVARYAIDRGLARDQVENIIGRALDQTPSGTLIPAHVGPALFARILEQGLGDAPAIEVAQNAPFSFFGGLERSIFLAPNGGAGLKAFAGNFAVFHDRLISVYDESARYSYFSFRFIGEELDNGCCNEVVLSVLLRLMRSVFGRYGQPLEVRTRFDRNGAASAYESFFDNKVRFRSPNKDFGFVFRKADMEWCQPGHDSELFDLATTRLSLMAADRRRRTAETEYLELINASNICVENEIFSVIGVCLKAGMSERTAQRVTQRNGSTVGKLIQEARLRRLREQVAADPHTSAGHLAKLAGLSDSRALRRALKKWTGQGLTEFRRSCRSGQLGK